MSKSIFRNVFTLKGKVLEKEYREDIGNGLGKMNVEADGNRVYVNVWNTRDNAVAESFMDQYQEGDYIQIQGELEEQEYNDEFRRNLRAWVSNKEGVMRAKKIPELSKGKAVVSLSGDVMKFDMKYTNDVAGMDLDEPIPVVNLTLVYFNTYNPNDKNTALTRAEVLINEIKRYGDYAKLNNEPADFDQLTKWISTLEEDNSVSNVLKILEAFIKTSARMFNVKTYHLVAYKDMATKLSEEVIEGDNVTLGLFVNNRLVEDDFGTIGESVNELEIGKLNSINERPEDNDSFGNWS